MGTTKEYIQFVAEQLDNVSGVTYKKMFGEYLVYVNDKPILLVCDNCVMVKEVPEFEKIMKDAPRNFPYDGAKEHYILDIENRELTSKVIEILTEITPVPKRRSKRK